MYWCLAAWLYIYIIFGDTWETYRDYLVQYREKMCMIYASV